MIFRYLLAAAIKPIRLIIWFITLIASLFFPYVIAIAGTAAYVALITFDVSRKSFRKEIDLKYKIAAIDYKWRKRAKVLVETIEGARVLISGAPKELKGNLAGAGVYFDSILNDTLNLITAISNLERFEKTSPSESISLKKAEMIKKLDGAESDIKALIGSSLLAITESNQITTVEVESLNDDVKALHDGLREARKDLAHTLDPDKATEEKFKELENSKEDKDNSVPPSQT